MNPEDFLTSLQIVELTRNQPSLKAVHDFHLKKCVDHAKELIPPEEPKAEPTPTERPRVDWSKPVKPTPDALEKAQTGDSMRRAFEPKEGDI